MKICKIAKCTGCGACVDICQKNCISFTLDKNGFFKPKIDEEKCVKCHRCLKICTANNPNKPNHIKEAYKARRTDAQAAAESTSGGIAAVLSEHFVKTGGVVVGCGFDEKFNLVHTIAANLEDLEKFKGSKYLQSNTVGICRLVKENLNKNIKVLFIGTPCQVSGLKNYLGKEYENLFLIDFVCHGVSSRNAFDKYIESLKQPTKPLSVKFRTKSNGYKNKKETFKLQVEYPGKTFFNGTDTGFYYWFSSSLSIRESCYRCPFVSADRASDITLADYIGNDFTETDDTVGVNTVFVNSDKGKVLFKFIEADITCESLDRITTEKKYNRLYYTAYIPKCRDSFFIELPVSEYSSLEKKYTPKTVLPSKITIRYYSLKRQVQKYFLK